MQRINDRGWKEFELYVADLYRELGAIDVVCDINIEGNQIDVYAHVPVFDGTYMRAVVSCKYYSKNVGVEDVREWITVTKSLVFAGKADIGVIVSSKDFTQDAQALARLTGIKLIPIESLKWASVNFKPYLEAMISDFSKESVFSKKYYVPMRLRLDGSRKEIPVETAIEQFLSDESHHKLFLLLGDYGAGKTTVSKHIFMTIARKYLNGEHGIRVPIFVNLRDYPQYLHVQSMITNLLVNQYKTRCPGFVAVDRLLREGRILVILDAFDEMASRANYQTTLQNFHAIRSLLVGHGKVILTCRSHYFKSRNEIEKTAGGTELYKLSIEKGYSIGYLQGFNSEEIKEYIEMVCKDKSEEYYCRIKKTYNLLGIAERPILLDMITEVLPQLIEKKQDISSSTLYQTYTSYWLERDDWRTILSSELREKFTIAFAESMYRQKKSRFTWNEVENAINEHWPNHARKDIEYYQYDIRTCSFIKMIPETDEYMFIHDSFAEFFVSSYLYQALVQNDPQPFICARYSPEIIGFLSERPKTAQIRRNLVEWMQARNANLAATSFILFCKWEKIITNICFRDVRLENIEIPNVNFVEVKYERVRQKEVKYYNCEVTKGIFIETIFDMCNFHNTNFQESSFERCVFRHCIFNMTKNSLINVLGGSFTECDFTKARLEGIVFNNTLFGENTWSFKSLEGVEFVGISFATDGKNSLITFLKSCKGQRWETPPLLHDISGVDKELLNQLIKHGAKIIDK